MHNLRSRWMLLAVVVMGIAAATVPWPVAAQSDTPLWRAPVAVWESQGTASAPQMVTDAAGISHLFFIGHLNDSSSNALYHVAVGQGEPYQPADMLVFEVHDYRDYRVAADPFGWIHLIFRQQNELWYSRASSDQAGDAGAWTVPIALVTASPGADLSVSADGALHICFPRGAQVQYLTLPDAGAS